MSLRRPAAALVALVAVAGVVASCAPEYALYPRLRQRKAGLGPIEVVSVDPRARVRAVLLDSQRSTVLTGTSGR